MTFFKKNLPLLLVIFTNSAYGQLGVKMGVNISDRNASYQPGIYYAKIVHEKNQKILSIQEEFLFTRISGEYEFREDKRLSAFNIVLLLKYYDVENLFKNLFIQLGPSLDLKRQWVQKFNNSYYSKKYVSQISFTTGA